MIPAAAHANPLKVNFAGINVEITSDPGGWTLAGHVVDDAGGGQHAYVLCTGNPTNTKLNLTFTINSESGMDYEFARVGETIYDVHNITSHTVFNHNLAEHIASSIEFTIRASEEETGGTIHLIPARISEVSFGGDSYHELKSDDLSQTYSAPQWQDNDGGAHAQNEKNQSVAYTKNTKPEIGAKFNVPGLPAAIPVYAQAFLGEAPLIPSEAPCERSGDVATKPMAEAQQAFPDKICFYPKGAANAYSIRWQLSLDNQQWSDVATTKHQVYVTRTAPAATLTEKRESLFYLACNQASDDGLDGNDLLALTNSIYKNFQSLEIRSINPDTGLPDGVFLRYWGDALNNDPHILVSKMKVCGGWAAFLAEVLSVHKIPSAVIGITSKKQPHHGSFEPFAFLLNEVTIKHPMTTEPVRTSTPDDQGHTKAAATTWPGHAILQVNDRYYDPSYGTPKIGSPNIGHISQDEWENNTIGALKGFVDGTTTWIPQNPNEHDVTFTPLP